MDFYLFIAWQDTNEKLNCRDSCKAHKASCEEPRVVYAVSSPGARAWFSVGNKAVMSSLISTVESVWWSQWSALWINIRMSSIINDVLSKAVHDPNPMFVRKAQLAFWNKCEVFDVSLGINIFFIPPKFRFGLGIYDEVVTIWQSLIRREKWVFPSQLAANMKLSAEATFTVYTYLGLDNVQWPPENRQSRGKCIF